MGPKQGAHELFEYVRDAIETRGAPPPDGETLYLVYLPLGTISTRFGTENTDCDVYGGYHAAFGTRGDGIAVVQRCAPQWNERMIDVATEVGSHEVIEAATNPVGFGLTIGAPSLIDPWTRSVWMAARGVEVADLCEGSRHLEGGHVYARSYAMDPDARGGDPCLPARGDPYFNVAAPAEWIDVKRGKEAIIGLRGYATSGREDWRIGAWVIRQDPRSQGGFGARVDGGPAYSSPAAISNDGYPASLTVALPDAGDWAVIGVASLGGRLGVGPTTADDATHWIPVGIHIVP